MKTNKLTIQINRPVYEVFEFTTNPKNTHLWIDSIIVELSEKHPPEIGTIYKNRGNGENRDQYKVTKYEKDNVFELSDLDKNYFVRYTYTAIDENTTEMEYFEWVNEGELSKPFEQKVLEKLKLVIETL